MELVVFILVCIIVLQRRLYREPIIVAAPRMGTWWKVTFKTKKTPPMEVEGPTEAVVLRTLMAKGQVDYKAIATIERIP